MNENLNLVEILKDCPKGTKLYSTIFGEVDFDSIENNSTYPIIIKSKHYGIDRLSIDGKRFVDCGECALFPSKEQRDWSKFTTSLYNVEKQDKQKKQVHFPKFTFDDVLALQCCMETVKKVQEDKELYDKLNLIHNKMYDAYWLEKQDEQASPQTNERAWLYLVSDVLTWKDGIGQYLDDTRVQELAKRLCSKYAQKLYKHQVISDNSNIEKNEQKSSGEIEPKFKVGNWYQCTKNFVGKGVIFDRNTAYYCAQEGCLQDEYGCHIAIVKDLYDRFKLWTIQDAKDGDILAISWREDEDLWEKIVIFKKYHSDGVKGLYSTPCVEGYGNTFKNGKLAFKEEVPYYSRKWTCDLLPATKEQRDTFMKAMNDTGYEWDTEKKELKKLVEPKFDPKTLKPFDKVLVRDYSDDVWNCSILSHTQQKGRYNYACINGANWEYCIPYNDDTKHLVGTTEEAPDYYRYLED